MSPEFLKDIEAIIKENPFGEKVFIVPSGRDGRLAVQALAKRGIPVINVHSLTADDLINRHPDCDQAVRGKQECSQEAGRQFIYTCMKTLKSQDAFRYFSQVKLSPSLSEGVYRALLDIRLAGRRHSDLNGEIFINEDKGADVALLFRSYETYLEENNLYDRADLYLGAIEAELRGLPGTAYIYFPHDAYHPLQARFLENYTADGILHIPEWTRVENTDQNRQLLELDYSVKPERSLQELIKDRKEKIRLSVKFSPEEELYDILAYLKENRIPFDQAAVLYPSNGSYRNLLRQIRDKEGIPITFSEGMPLSTMPSGKAALAYLHWLKSDFDLAALDRLLNERLIKTPEGIEIFHELGKLKKREGAVKGYTPLMRAVNELEKKGGAAEMTAWLRRLLNISPFHNTMEKVSGAECLKAVCEFLKEWARPVSPEDESAKMHAVSMIEQESPQLTFELKAGDAVSQCDYWLSSMQVISSMPEPGHLHAAPLRSALMLDSVYTFMVGMTNQNIPGSQKEDPVLLDEERTRIHPRMMTSKEQAKREVWKTSSLAVAHEGFTSYSYPVMDLTGNRKSAPAYTFIQLFRFINDRPDATGEETEKAMTGSLAFVSRETSSVSRNGWWLDKLWRKASVTDSDLINERFRHLLEGIKAEQARREPYLTPFEGLVEGLTEDLDPLSSTGGIMSSSRLETLAACPYRYFLREILKVEPEEEEEEDRYKWLDPATRGTLLHTVFERFYQELYDEGKTPELDGTAEWLKGIANEEIAKVRKILPPPNEVIAELETREILDACFIFLKVEESFTAGRKPVHFELAFGFRNEEPVTIPVDDSRSLTVRGKIDRVDLLEDGTYGTVDYKSGKPYGYDDDLYFNGGRKLQHALYALAFEMLHESGEKRVTQSHYLFPTEKGNGHQASRPYNEEKKQDLLRIVETLSTFIRSGQFPYTEDPSDCTFCEVKEVCMRHRYDEDTIQEKLSEASAPGRLLKEVRSYD
ncbi:PD-(D/E)XK nuclease family protein [Alteribacter natronophilus]|uniref:PD-(D/E)XK nuclease family protein n=1 Tax=Alteribacter natronophilus TaxID=2583810 RepID=UPI00110E4DC1|nr:PD-(D/E)XK nuclease family protein [Alteribacter natronophilus]TMW73485.1 hypothetical protein FGB90_04075 [Alteribacter natronophilus]